MNVSALSMSWGPGIPRRAVTDWGQRQGHKLPAHQVTAQRRKALILPGGHRPEASCGETAFQQDCEGWAGPGITLTSARKSCEAGFNCPETKATSCVHSSPEDRWHRVCKPESRGWRTGGKGTAPNTSASQSLCEPKPCSFASHATTHERESQTGCFHAHLNGMDLL